MLRRSAQAIRSHLARVALRRVTQVACFLGFLVLFFYVACPYPTRPARVWDGWTPVDVDLEARRIVVEAARPPAEPLPTDRELHVFDTGRSPPDYLGALRVVEASENQAVLEPTAACPLRRWTNWA